MALGAIGEGCMNGLYPHLSQASSFFYIHNFVHMIFLRLVQVYQYASALFLQIVAFLLPLLDDKFPLIRSISCWTLSRFGKYLIQVLFEQDISCFNCFERSSDYSLLFFSRKVTIRRVTNNLRKFLWVFSADSWIRTSGSRRLPVQLLQLLKRYLLALQCGF